MPVELLGENGIAVMDEQPVRVLRGDCFAQLLKGPWCGRMRRDMGMQNPARGVLHDHQDGAQAKGCRDHDAEVTGNNRLHVDVPLWIASAR